MSLTLDENNAIYQIRAFQPGCIQVNEEIFSRSIVISANQLITDWEPQKILHLTSSHLSSISSMHPAIFLLGTGETLQFPDPEIYGDLINQGIGVEIMNTSAACRTYNALTSEGRDVVAGLIIK